MKKFFDLLYHPLAWSYDLVAWIVSGGRWKEWVRSVLPLVAGDEVLELGSGTGTLQTALIAAGYRVTAVDQSREMLSIVRRKFSDGIPARQPRLIRACAESLPLPSAFADTIAATFPSEYISCPETLLECRRVLKNGGRLVVLLGVAVGGKGVYDLFLRFLYVLTGQRTPPVPILNKTLEMMNSFGFQARIETIYFRQDRLTVIVAE